MTKHIGILTSGGDSPGLNAAIRAVGKGAHKVFGTDIVGFYEGFRGLMSNRSIRLGMGQLSGILTRGGTILGTSRDKPHKMPVGGKLLDMTDSMVETYRKHQLDVLVCLGGGGTQKNAHLLAEKGLNIITLPKTIDNDVAGTDVTFGFDTALGIATEALDRLHSTAHSHHRIIVVEIMGHNTGWLALGAGLAGGADVILIPEIPYNVEKVAAAIRSRSRDGKRFSIVAVSEGAMPLDLAAKVQVLLEKKDQAKGKERRKIKNHLTELRSHRSEHTLRLTRRLERLTDLESRLTILGHLQRGGAPSAADRLLATRIGSACIDFIAEGRYGIMVGVQGQGTVAVPLEEIVGRRKTVPIDHPWIRSARQVGTAFGD